MTVRRHAKLRDASTEGISVRLASTRRARGDESNGRRSVTGRDSLDDIHNPAATAAGLHDHTTP